MEIISLHNFKARQYNTMKNYQILSNKQDDSSQIKLEIFHPFLPNAQQLIQDIPKQIAIKDDVKNNTTIQTFGHKKYMIKKQMSSITLSSGLNNQFNFGQVDISKTVKHIFKSNYQKLLEQYKGGNKKFTDPDFPPIGSSIGGRWANHNNWKRISEVITNAVFVNEKIEPSDILQGEIGDCYFLSALASLAEKDHRIKNIFQSFQIQSNGIYMARVLHRGILHEVVVDDFIPVNAKNQPLFAKASGGKEIWVVILEKCWAKLHKSYAAISGGLPHEVLHAFSGAPTFLIDMPKTQQQLDALFEVIYRADQNGAVLCCGTKSDLSIQKKGLVIGHAYTLLDVYKYPCRMVKVRNPWGQKEWNGRGAQTDIQFWSKISLEDKKKLGLQTKNDGTFFMLWEDFINVFQMVDICQIEDTASYLCSSSSFTPDKGNMFELNIHTSGKVVIAVTQAHMRSFKSELQKQRGYAKTTIIFSKYSQKKKGYQFSFSKASQYHALPDHYMTFDNIETGKYMIFVQCNWFENTSKAGTVSVYSTQTIELLPRSDIDAECFLYQVFMDHARKNIKKQQSLSTQYEEWKCSQFMLGKCDYGYAAYHLDERSTSKLCIELDERQYQSKNMRLLKPYAGHGKIRTSVEPGKELIILFKMDAYKISPSFTIPLPRVIKQVQ